MKHLIACSLSCLALQALANPSFTGFYVAGAIGGTSATYTIKQEVIGGVTAGAGIERLFTKHFSLALEYAYTSYSSIDSPTNQAHSVRVLHRAH